MRIKATFLFFVIVFCFSCSYLPQIEKRHYRDGFYVGKQKENEQVAVKHESPEQILSAKKWRCGDTLSPLRTFAGFSAFAFKTNNGKCAVEKKKTFCPRKTAPKIKSVSIDPPREPFNKKARTAQIFFVLARLTLIAAFIVSLFSFLSTTLIVAGVAALFALLAMLFGIWARKELAAQPAYERELGDKEAKQVIGRAAGGIGSAAFIILIALLVDWIRRQNGR